MNEFDFDFDDKPEELNDTAETQPKKSKLRKVVTVVVAFILLIASFIGGIMIGGSYAPAKPEIQKVKAIESKSSVIENLESLKDSQIKNLSDKLKSIKVAAPQDQQAGSAPNADLLKAAQVDMLKLILKGQNEQYQIVDEFLELVMAMKKDASKDEIEASRKLIAEKMTAASQVTKSHDIVNGASAAKMLGQNGRKASSSTMWIDWADEKARVYVAITPFMTAKEVLTHQISVIKVVDGKIDDYKFVGIMNSSEPGSLESALSSIGRIGSDKEAGEIKIAEPTEPAEQPTETPQN